jgi:hypothetical protein
LRAAERQQRELAHEIAGVAGEHVPEIVHVAHAIGDDQRSASRPAQGALRERAQTFAIGGYRPQRAPLGQDAGAHRIAPEALEVLLTAAPVEGHHEAKRGFRPVAAPSAHCGGPESWPPRGSPEA